MPTITIPKDQRFEFLINPQGGWCIKSIYISFVAGQEGTRIQPDSFAKHLIVIEPDGTEREAWIKVRLTSWDNLFLGGGGGGNGYLPLAGSTYDIGNDFGELLNKQNFMTGRNIMFDRYDFSIVATKREVDNNDNTVSYAESGIYADVNSSLDYPNFNMVFSFLKNNMIYGSMISLFRDYIEIQKFGFENKHIGLIMASNIYDNIMDNLNELSQEEKNRVYVTVGMLEQLGGGGQTISIISHTISAPLTVGNVSRITVLTTTNANSNNINIVTMSNVTVVQVSSTAGQWVADITPQSAGAVTISAFSNNGMNASNVPYIVGNAVVYPTTNGLLLWFDPSNVSGSTINSLPPATWNGVLVNNPSVTPDFVHFNGSNNIDIPLVGGTSPFRQSSGITVIVFAKSDLSMGTSSNGGHGSGGHYFANTQTYYIWTPTSPPSDSLISATHAATGLNTYMRATAIDYISGTYSMYLNDTLLPASTSVTGFVPNTSYNSTVISDKIGARWVNSIGYAIGSMGVMMIYNRKLSSVEITNIYNYYKDRYGI